VQVHLAVWWRVGGGRSTDSLPGPVVDDANPDRFQCDSYRLGAGADRQLYGGEKQPTV